MIGGGTWEGAHARHENPNNPVSELNTRDVMAAAPALGLKVQILKASSDREIDAAFVGLVQARIGALIIENDLFFNNRIEQLIALAARHAIPVMYPYREFVVAGGLIRYGISLSELYRQVGLYAGRILKGEKPRPAGAGHEVRAGHQSQDREDTRPGSAADAARARRRGDRMSAPGKAGAIQPVEDRPK